MGMGLGSVGMSQPHGIVGPQKKALLRQHHLTQVANTVSEREMALWEGDTANSPPRPFTYPALLTRTYSLNTNAHSQY